MSDISSPLHGVTKRRPCPVCDGDHKCSVTDDGLILCGRRTGDQPGFRCLGPGTDPTWTLYRGEGDAPQPSYDDIMYAIKHGGLSHRPAPKHHTPPADFTKVAADFARHFTPERRAELAALLGLPADPACWPQDIGFDPAANAFTFPECDEEMGPVGVVQRFRDGTKSLPHRLATRIVVRLVVRQPPRTRLRRRRGHRRPRPRGVRAVRRRPAERHGGVELLAKLFRRAWTAPRPVVVVGENDRKPDGLWPGRDGAEGVANRLADVLPDWSVRWALPPEQYKDARAWVVDLLGGRPGDAEFRDQTGKRIANWLTGRAVAATPKSKPVNRFPLLVPLSEIVGRATGGGVPWVWDGFLARGCVTLLSALPKAGKTTLIAELLKQLERGGTFAGRALCPGRAVVVSEEGTEVWVARRDGAGVPFDHVRLACRPFFGKPDAEAWLGFVLKLRDALAVDPADLVVFDTLADLWPVRDENNATDVQTALQPLRRLAEGRAVLLVHHLRKSDGDEGTAARGSGALAGFVDVLAELRRAKPAVDPCGRRRVIKAVGRFDGVPKEWLVERADDGSFDGRDGTETESATEKRREERLDELREAILAILPLEGDGLTREDIWARLPDEVRKNESNYNRMIQEGTGRSWTRMRRPGRGGAFVYWRKEE